MWCAANHLSGKRTIILGSHKMIQIDLTSEKNDVPVGFVEVHLVQNQKPLCFLLHQQGHSLAEKVPKKGLNDVIC